MNEPNIGQVLFSTSENGNQVDKAEMLLLPKAKLALEYKDNKVIMQVSDTNFLTDNLNGDLNLSTLDDLIKILCRMRNQLERDNRK